MEREVIAEALIPNLSGLREALEFLQARLGLDLWMITRTEGEDWIVLDAVDRHYGIQRGDVFRWSDSFCSRMVQRLGPSIAPRSREVQAYREAPISREIQIEAYVGLPLHHANGELFGTLCAIDPRPQSEALEQESGLLEIISLLLSSLLQSELRTMAARREAERLRTDSVRDQLTGLVNRRGWEQALDLEEQRCRRYGNPAAILIIDLDELKRTNDEHGHEEGDRLLISAARVLEACIRHNDLVARIGGDEFAILTVESSAEGASQTRERIARGFEDAKIRASIGAAARDPKSDLRAAMRLADARMYEAKHQRSTQAPQLTGQGAGSRGSLPPQTTSEAA